MEQPSDRLFCCQWLRDRLSPTNREELYILKRTDPLVSFGIQAATCVQVGNALGAEDTDRAIVISKMSVNSAGIVGVLVGICCSLSYMFTSNKCVTCMQVWGE